MSRRHTPSHNHLQLSRLLGTALVLLVSLAAAWPAAVAAQDDGSIDQDFARRWQLLTYRDAGGDTETVPAGVGAIVDLFANSAIGEAACSSYATTYDRSLESLTFLPPAIEAFACDPASEAFDQAFYQNLADTRSFTVSDSIMTLRDETLAPLMTLTRAVIDKDPTVARWELARIGAADGSIEPVIQGLNPWVEFTRGGRILGDTGCGKFYGWYETNDGTIRITDVASRLEGCTESARRQAEQTISTLSETTDFEVLPAGMVLRDEAGSTRLALVPAIDLGGRSWTPIEILDANGDALYPRERLSTSTVKFQGRAVEGRSICRPFAGRSLNSGLALSTAGIKSADDPCPKKADLQLENDLIGSLAATSSHALRGSELELKDVDGRTLMRLVPQAELVGPTWVVTQLRQPKGSKPAKRKPLPDTTLTAEFEDPDSGVVTGDTGASFYTAFYETPAAAEIAITDVRPEGNACSNAKRAAKPLCRQEALLIALLQEADGYVVEDDQLRLFRGPVALIWFTPEDMVSTTP